MKTLRAFVRRVARGEAASRMLGRLGIDAKKFWLLMDLFEQVALRREFMGGMGRDEFSLKFVALFLCVSSALLAVVAVIAQLPESALLLASLSMTTFVMLFFSLAETGNSLLNPEEALILAHQPIDGRTYTTAKLSHLLKLLVYIVFGLNLLPAVAGLGLKAVSWAYPIKHLMATMAVGLLIQLLVCAFYGWLLCFLPPDRLRRLSQIADALMFAGFALMGPIFSQAKKVIKVSSFAIDPRVAVMLYAGIALGVVVFLVVGLRLLSGDYLIKVSSIARTGSQVKRKTRASWLGAIVARVCGGAAGRAGFEYTRRLMRRDWMFLKQLLMCVYLLVMMVVFVSRDIGKSPFAAQFSSVHVLPHALGVCAFFVCMMLPYGGDYKGAWVFQTVAPRVFNPFARGVHSVLWFVFAVVPHLLLLPFIWWFWGWWQASLFTAYSVAFVSLYLAAEIRIVERVPFSAQMDPKRGAMMMPIMFGGAFGIAIVVALQYFLLFRVLIAVVTACAVVGAIAWFLTRISTRALADDMRFHLSIEANEIGEIYVEL